MGHKTLHESAAEILAASVANAGKEPIPMGAMMNPTADLGGELPTGVISPIAAASTQAVPTAQKPGQPGVPAEEIKSLADAEEMEENGEDEEDDEENEKEMNGKKEDAEEEKDEEEEEDDEEEMKNSNKLMESLIAEHGPELVLENLITEYGDAEVFNSMMEEYVQQFGEDTVYEKFGETLVEQYGEEAVAQFVVESVVAEFHEQEFSDEEFQSLAESSQTFITEMQALSEEEFSDYIANLTEEELVSAIQLSSLNEEYLVEFLKKIGKALKKGVKAVGKVAKKVISNPLFSTVASFALPGVGTALGALGGKLASTALGKAVGAVGSKIASSALGKGVAALGKTAIGGALKTAAGSAIKSGIGSKLQGGSFSQGAKAGALGSLVGSAAGALGSGVSRLTGSQLAGDVTSQLAGTAGETALANRQAAQQYADYGDETGEEEQPVRAAAQPQQTRVAAAPQQRPQQRRPAARDNNYDYADTWTPIKRGSRMVAEEANEILEHLSSLNEEQLSQFVDQLSEEDSEFIADLLEQQAAAPKYGEKGTGANKGKFWTGKKWQLPSEMSDEDRYGKTGAAIRKLSPEKFASRPKTAAGNLELLKQLQTGAAPAAQTMSSTPAAEPTAAAAPVRRERAAAAPRQRQSDSNWDYQDTWEQNPIARADQGGYTGQDVEDQEQKPEKTYGERAIDQVKRTGRAAIRTGIGGAILGQDWKDAAQAGATGQVVGDAWKALVGGFRNERKKQKGMNENFEESLMNGEETTMETTELTEEQIREERMLAIKEAVKEFKGNMREDVDALFNGESLSEEFRAKATLIFESAVTSRVESILEQVMQQNDEVLANAYEEIKGQLTEQVDEYLNYVVEQWMEENQVAIETGLRAELAEDFISGLRSLFQEHYIEIPEEKVDVAETLATELDQAAEYVETVHQHVAEQDETIAALQEQLNIVKKEKAVNAFCEGLTAVQAGKMKALAEGVEFTTEGDFEEKLAVLRENYFPTKVQVKSEVKELQQVALNEEPEVAPTNNVMNRYVQAIAKTAPKA